MEWFKNYQTRKLTEYKYSSSALKSVTYNENLEPVALPLNSFEDNSTYFYCRSCRTLIESSRAFLLHTNKDSHSKAAFCSGRCADLAVERIADDEEMTQSVLIQRKFVPRPFLGLDEITVVRNMSNLMVYWICSACYVEGLTFSALLRHLQDCGHIDRVAESVRSEVNSPMILRDLDSVIPFETKIHEKELLLTRDKSVKNMQGYKLPWLQNWDYSAKRKGEEKIHSKSFLVDFLINPAHFPLFYDKLPKGSSVLLKECNTVCLNERAFFKGLSYLTEIWLPGGQAVALYYCCLCDYLNHDWKGHVDSALHNTKFSILPKNLQNQSMSVDIANLIQLKMNAGDSFLPIRASNFTPKFLELANFVPELRNVSLQHFPSHSDESMMVADEPSSEGSIVTSNENCSQISAETVEKLPKNLSAPKNDQGKKTMSVTSTNLKLTNEIGASMKIDKLLCPRIDFEIPSLPRFPSNVELRCFDELSDCVSNFYELLLAQNKIIENSDKIIRQLSAVKNNKLSVENRDDELAAEKRRQIKSVKEVDPFHPVFGLCDLPQNFICHVLKVLEWFDAYVRQVLLPLGNNVLSGYTLDVVSARLRDWEKTYPDDSTTVQKAVRVLVTLLFTKIRSFYETIDDQWLENVGNRVETIVKQVFKNHQNFLSKKKSAGTKKDAAKPKELKQQKSIDNKQKRQRNVENVQKSEDKTSTNLTTKRSKNEESSASSINFAFKLPAASSSSPIKAGAAENLRKDKARLNENAGRKRKIPSLVDEITENAAKMVKIGQQSAATVKRRWQRPKKALSG